MCGRVSEGVEAYSPNKVVTAREYRDTKEAVELTKAKAKEERKIQKAANALRNKQLKKEREARQAAAQLAKDLQAANKAPRDTLPKQTKVVATKAKKSTAAVLKTKKTPLRASPVKKSARKKVVQVAPRK